MANLLRKLPPTGTLVAFESAARLLSFTRAGAELNISQAAVSKQIQRLEADLNLPLFERQHRSLQLTAAGHTLFTTVQTGLNDIASVTESLRARASEDPVTIGISVGMATYCLMPRLGLFRARHPGIDVRVLAVDRDVDPRAEGVDIAIRYADKHKLPNGSVRLYDEVVVPVCSPSFAASGTLNSVEDLPEQTLLHLDPDHWRDLSEAPIDWPRWLANFGVAQRPTRQGLTINNYVMLLQAAINGEGIALGWRPIVDDLLDNGLLVAASDQQWFTGRCHYLITASSKPREPVHLLSRWLAEELIPARNC